MPAPVGMQRRAWCLRLALLALLPGTFHSLMHVPLHGPLRLCVSECAPMRSRAALCLVEMGGGEAGARRPGSVARVKRGPLHRVRPFEQGAVPRTRRGPSPSHRAQLRVDASSRQVQAQAAVVRGLLARRPLEPADVGRMSSGEVGPQQLWSAGPAVVLAELLRATLLLAVVVKHATGLTLQVAALAVRSVLWVLEWAIRVGDAKEWWIPDLVDFADRTSKDPRTMRYYRLARIKLRAVLVLLYSGVAAALSPELVAKGEAWAQDLWQAAQAQGRLWGATAKSALESSSLPNDNEPRSVLADADSSSNQGGGTGGTHGGTSANVYADRLEATRASHVENLGRYQAELRGGDAARSQRAGAASASVSGDAGTMGSPAAGRHGAAPASEEGQSRADAAGARTRDVLKNATTSVLEKTAENLDRSRDCRPLLPDA